MLVEYFKTVFSPLKKLNTLIEPLTVARVVMLKQAAAVTHVAYKAFHFTLFNPFYKNLSTIRDDLRHVPK
jgi:hypothetical protein